MPEYIIAYLGGAEPETPEAGAAQRQKWHDWLEGIGEHVLNPGTPLGPSKRVSAAGVSEAGPDCMNGFTVVHANNFDEALEMAQSCPFLEIGDLQVSEVKSMG